MATFYLMNAPADADALDVPEGMVISAADSDMLESEFIVEVDSIDALLSYGMTARVGVDIAPYADGADEMGVDGTLEFYALDDVAEDDAALEESI